MLKKIFEILKKIFGKNSEVKELKMGIEIGNSKYKEEQGFRSKIKFNNLEECEIQIKGILAKNEHNYNQEELKEKLLLYIDLLIAQIDECQNDITICKASLGNINS